MLAQFSLRWLNLHVWRAVHGISRNTGPRHSVLYASDPFFLSQVFPESFPSRLADVRGDTLVTGCVLSPACVPCRCCACPDLLPLGIPPSPCGALGDTLTPQVRQEILGQWGQLSSVLLWHTQEGYDRLRQTPSWDPRVGTSHGPRLAPQTS